uniref:Uncharacterized protein n=1 Tax=Nonomuraea gerenzanensis TaxID=93944 RepID=A0A1M4DVQ4_9ACTN|nr:hypothetical protein BN4615_P135 [Nonomuraea gerenzanensis]
MIVRFRVSRKGEGHTMSDVLGGVRQCRRPMNERARCQP